jgi:hypothetical protein
MKKNWSNKPVGVIIHIYVEVSQGNSLCIYHYLKQAKVLCFSFNLLSFFLYRIIEQEGRTIPAQGGGLTPEGGQR